MISYFKTNSQLCIIIDESNPRVIKTYIFNVAYYRRRLQFQGSQRMALGSKISYVNTHSVCKPNHPSNTRSMCVKCGDLNPNHLRSDIRICLVHIITPFLGDAIERKGHNVVIIARDLFTKRGTHATYMRIVIALSIWPDGDRTIRGYLKTISFAAPARYHQQHINPRVDIYISFCAVLNCFICLCCFGLTARTHLITQQHASDNCVVYQTQTAYS